MNYQNIKIENLLSHPSNPRKDLGDLTELAESIKQKGILQNLTVVPAEEDGKYTIIIGHRRTAAAKLAGLTEVPCVVTAMDPAEQVKTMLLENIQRSDLSVYEESMSFRQLTLDFGETAESIAASTGFSVGTIRHRIRLSELDKEAFQKAEQRNPKITDYIKLEQIKNPKYRNACLEYIGTNNFERTVESYKSKEAREENTEKVITVLEGWGAKLIDKKEKERIMSVLRSRWFSVYSNAEPENITIPEDVEEGSELFYYPDEYGIYFFYNGKKPVVDPEIEEQKNKSKALNDRLKAIGQSHYKLRRDFIASYNACKKHIEDIVKFSLKMAAQSPVSCSYGSVDRIANILGVSIDTSNNYNHKLSSPDYLNEVEKNPFHTFLVNTYATYDNETNDYINFSYDYKTQISTPEFKANKELDAIYDFLVKLGYQMSDEEMWAKEGKLLEHLADEGAENTEESVA